VVGEPAARRVDDPVVDRDQHEEHQGVSGRVPASGPTAMMRNSPAYPPITTLAIATTATTAPTAPISGVALGDS
jgi:hypothetical protein